MPEKEQFEILVQKYLPVFLPFSLSRINDVRQAEELSQEIAYQCLLSLRKGRCIGNLDAYIWSIAHNTYKRWFYQKNSKHCIRSLDDEEIFNNFSNTAINIVLPDHQLIKNEEIDFLHRQLSHLSELYRKVLVHFYFDELSIRETAEKLGLSDEMVKFYLSKGKEKIKEAYSMNDINQKSFNPSEFSIYKSGIDFSKINIWEVFKRKLPCQIAIVCHDSAKTISDISIETGTPAVYIEDEVKLLLDAGVMISPVKNKYRTNFHILKKNTAEQLKKQFMRLHEDTKHMHPL